MRPGSNGREGVEITNSTQLVYGWWMSQVAMEAGIQNEGQVKLNKRQKFYQTKRLAVFDTESIGKSNKYNLFYINELRKEVTVESTFAIISLDKRCDRERE